MKIKNLVVSMALVLGAAFVSGCTEQKVETTGVGYGLVHGHYAGEISLVVNPDGTVKSATVEEYFLPYNWAKVTPADTSALPADILEVVGSRGTSYYSKYIQIGGKVFTGAVVGSSGAQSINYTGARVTNFEEWIKGEAAAKWYVEQVKANKFGLSTNTGAASAYTRTDATSNTSMKKSEAGYWPAPSDNATLGWAANIAAFKTAIVGTSLNQFADGLAKEGKFWKVGTVVSGATMTDFSDYYALAQRAYANAA